MRPCWVIHFHVNVYANNYLVAKTITCRYFPYKFAKICRESYKLDEIYKI